MYLSLDHFQCLILNLSKPWLRKNSANYYRYKDYIIVPHFNGILRLNLFRTTVIAYNLPNITKPLILSMSTVAKIFTGVIKRWNDSEFQVLNPNLDFPNQRIRVLVRK